MEYNFSKIQKIIFLLTIYFFRRDNDMDDFDSFLESLDFDNLNEMGTLFDSEE